MLRIEIVGFEDLLILINLFKKADDEEIKTLTEGLKKSTDILKQAEKKDGEMNASTGSH